MITFNNDHKEKFQSYTVRFKDDNDLYSAFCKEKPMANAVVFSYSVEDVCGYGATKEEAIANFRMALKYYMKEMEAIKKLYIDDPTFLENNIVEVDCFGKIINKENKEV